MTTPMGPQSLDPRPPSALWLVNTVLRARRMIVGASAVAFLVVIGSALLARRTYTAVASFTPASGSAGGVLLAGIAAQLGVAANAPEQSPQFYAELVETREILGQLAGDSFSVDTGARARSGTLMDVLQIKGSSADVRLDRAVVRLRGLIEARTSVRTGVVIVTVRSRWPELSAALDSRLLDLVNRFNLETRQTQAASERRFVQERLDSVRRDLRAAEDRLLQFLQGNREYRSSPLLVFEQERLAREVGVHQQVFASLSQAYEQARIEAVRNTPVITMIERPTRPVRPDRRRLLAKGILALLFGGAVGIGLAFGKEAFATSGRQDPDLMAAYRQLRDETVRDMRRAGLLFLRRRER